MYVRIIQFLATVAHAARPVRHGLIPQESDFGLVLVDRQARPMAVGADGAVDAQREVSAAWLQESPMLDGLSDEEVKVALLETEGNGGGQDDMMLASMGRQAEDDELVAHGVGVPWPGTAPKKASRKEVAQKHNVVTGDHGHGNHDHGDHHGDHDHGDHDHGDHDHGDHDHGDHDHGDHDHGHGISASDAELAVASTLFAMIALIMTLFFFVNSADSDVRAYTWTTISSTLSIFCAVLIFEAVKHPCHLLTEEIWLPILQALFWTGWLQVVLLLAVRTQVENEDEPSWSNPRVLNVKCFSALFAHVAGFAWIDVWQYAQQQAAKANRFYMMAPIAIFGLIAWFIIFRFLSYVRFKWAYRNDKHLDEEDEIWEEEACEAESEGAGLCVAYLFVNALKSNITRFDSGRRPSPTLGAHRQGFVEHSRGEVAILFFIAFLFLLAGGFLIVAEHRAKAHPPPSRPGAKKSAMHHAAKRRTALAGAGDEVRASDASVPAARGAAGRTSFVEGHFGTMLTLSSGQPEEEGHQGHHHGGGHHHEEMGWQHEPLHWLVHRGYEVMEEICMFCSAWCMVVAFGFIMQMMVQRNTEVWNTIMRVIQALLSTFVALFLMLILDRVEDARAGVGDKEARHVIMMAIAAFGVMIGFTWELAFDAAIADVSSRFGDWYAAPGEGEDPIDHHTLHELSHKYAAGLTLGITVVLASTVLVAQRRFITPRLLKTKETAAEKKHLILRRASQVKHDATDQRTVFRAGKVARGRTVEAVAVSET